MKQELERGLSVEELFGEDAVDVSDEVEVYDNGKTMECPECGAGTGVKKDMVAWECYDCGKMLVDTEFDSRENETPVGASGGQMELGDFA